MKTVTLDNKHRTGSRDHLIEYRESIFYPLLTKSVKERGDAYERDRTVHPRIPWI